MVTLQCVSCPKFFAFAEGSEEDCVTAATYRQREKARWRLILQPGIGQAHVADHEGSSGRQVID